jgi:hypothetical protein
MTPIVPAWDVRTAGTFKPSLTLRSAAPAAEMLEAVTNGLTTSGFKVTGSRELTAKYFGWKWALAGVLTAGDFPLALAKLTITAVDGAVTIRLASEHGGKEPGRKASEGLSRAVVDLRSRGFEVSVGDWGR